MQRPLADGLILRSLDDGTQRDRERLVAFYCETFKEAEGQEQPRLEKWLDDLLTTHPIMTPQDFFYVVDPADDDRIVSATLLIPQIWRYEDIEFPVGRPEIVATDKDYRRRGLVREVFKEVHARSEALGHLVQGITGIEHFYRQFGYAMAVDLGSSAVVPLKAIAPLKKGQQPTFTLRPATVEDVPIITQLDAQRGKEGILSAVRDEHSWRYEIAERHPESEISIIVLIIEDQDKQAVGFIAIQKPYPDSKFVNCVGYALTRSTSYFATFMDVVRGIAAFVSQDYPEIYMARFSSNMSPALFHMIDHTYGAKRLTHRYAWYLRVADLAKFLQTIAPVLERRLVGSVANAFTGKLTIGFFDFRALILEFEQGRLKQVVVEAANDQTKFDAEFPYHSFLNLVFGHRTLSELRHVLIDIGFSPKAAIILSALFPKKSHALYALG